MTKRLTRILAFSLTLMIIAAVVLTGCQPTPPPAPKPTTTAPAPTTAAPAPTTTAAPPPPAPFKWPDRIQVVSATGVGQAQWVSFTALMNKDLNINISVVPQGAPALRFSSVKNGENFATAGGASDWKNLLEADVQYAAKDGGPFQARIVWPFGISYSGFMVKKDSGIKTPEDIKAGMKFADLTTAPGLKQTQYPALMAWAKVDPATATYVPFGTYDATQNAVKDGKVDVAFCFTSSPGTLAVAPDCMLIEMDTTKDPAGAQRFLDIWTVGAFMKVQEGPPNFIGTNGNGGLTGITTAATTNADLVYNFAKWLDVNYATYKDAHPQNKYMTLDNMVILSQTMFLPVHEGTIKYLKEKGKWTAANDKRQADNIAFVQKWTDGFSAALKDAGAKGIAIEPVAASAWIKFWEQYKIDNKLPGCRTFLGL